MNFKEAEILATRINNLNCGGNPLVVYDGRVNGQPAGVENRNELIDTDPAVVLCRWGDTGRFCLYDGGNICPTGFTLPV